MNCFEQMVEEYKQIKRMLVIIRRYCYRILKQEDVNYEDFFKVIDFVRSYADKHHHGKEDALLFFSTSDSTPLLSVVNEQGYWVPHWVHSTYCLDSVCSLLSYKKG